MKIHLIILRDAIVMKKLVFLVTFLVSFLIQAQVKKVKVVEEKQTNRINFYAINEDRQDYDVLFTVKGSDFRQSAARPRWIRLPATSKVHLKTIILLRGKTPKYTPTLKINDSLSRRAMKKEFTLIEVPPEMISPKKHITIYSAQVCGSCDSIVTKLKANNYIFKLVNLDESAEVKTYLSRALKSPLDSLQNPIINLGGHLYTWISDYQTLLEELEK